MTDPDYALVCSARKGDGRAFSKLLNKYRHQVLYLAYDLLGNYEDAQDVAQEVFLRVHQKLNDFHGRSSFSTWLYRVSINLAIDFQRKAGRNFAESIQNEKNGLAHKLYDASTETRLERQEQRAEITRALSGLSLNQRTAIVLRYFHGKTSPEIAEIMQCNETTVRIHIHRGMNKLRNILRPIDG